MTLLDRLNPFSGPRRSLETKASSTQPAIMAWRRGTVQWSPKRYDQFSKVAYQANPVVYACVNKIAEAVAQLSYGLFETKARKEVEIEDHPLLDLMDAPQRIIGWEGFTRQAITSRMMAGNVFFEAVHVGRNVRELHILRPDRMRIEVKEGSLVWRYEVNGKIVYFPYDPERVWPKLWHWKAYHPTDDFWGLSPMEAAMRAIDQNNAYQDHNKAMLDNAAAPSGAFVYAPKDGAGTTNGRMPDGMFESLKKMLDERGLTRKQAGRPLLLEGGLEWQQFGLSHVDMQYLEGQRDTARDIARAFGVPPMILGIPGDNTYSNLAEANEDFYRSTVLPLAREYFSQIVRWLAPVYNFDGRRITIKPDEDEIPALADARRKKWEMVTMSDFLTVNEKREALGYGKADMKAKDAADQVMTDAGKVPLGYEPDGDETDIDEEDEPEQGKDEQPKQNGSAVQ